MKNATIIDRAKAAIHAEPWKSRDEIAATIGCHYVTLGVVLSRERLHFRALQRERVKEICEQLEERETQS